MKRCEPNVSIIVEGNEEEHGGNVATVSQVTPGGASALVSYCLFTK